MDKLNPLLAERAAKVADMRARVDASETRGEVTPDDQAAIEALTTEIRSLDERIERCENGRAGGSFGAMLSARSLDYGAGDHRTLGDVMAGEIRAIFTTGGGSALVPAEQLPRVFDRLAETAVGLKSGFTVIPTSATELKIPHLLSDIAAGWTEEGDTIVSSDPGLEPLTARPKKLAALTSMSNEVILDSNPKVLDLTFRNLLRALANGLDEAFYEGSGVDPEIKGLKNIAGKQNVSMGTNGAALTDLDPIIEALGLLEAENAEGTSIVMHPRTWADLMKLREQTGSLKPLLSESAGSPTTGVQRSLLGVPVWLNSKLATTETKGTSNLASSIYVYDAPQIVAVRREEARVEVDRSIYFDRDMTAVRGVVRWDLVVPNPKALVRIDGVIPAA
jgi:HK97 family phage major capsid protein